MPKFLQDDLKLFNGIVSDLFPKTKQEPINYGILEESMRNVCIKKNMKDVDGESESESVDQPAKQVLVTFESR